MKQLICSAVYCNCIAKGSSSCWKRGGGSKPMTLLGFHQLRSAVEENLKALNELTPQRAAIEPRLTVAKLAVCVCLCLNVFVCVLPPHDARTFFN